MDIKQTSSFSKWINGLRDGIAKAAIAARIYRLSNGLAGDSKHVGEGVRELRINHGPGYRVYFQQKGDVLIILLCGGNKSTQQADIEQAKRIAKELETDDE